MTKAECLFAANQRMQIAQQENHPNWYEGMLEDAEDELRAAEAMPEALVEAK